MISKDFENCGKWLPVGIVIALILALVAGVISRFGRGTGVYIYGQPATTHVYVLAYYPGMDKEELSSAVVEPIKKALIEITRTLYSQSEFGESGVCLLTVNMLGTPEDSPELLTKVSNRIEGVKPLLPQGTMVKTTLNPPESMVEAERTMKKFASEFSEENDL